MREQIPKAGELVFLDGHAPIRYKIISVDLAKKTVGLKTIAGANEVIWSVPWAVLRTDIDDLR